MSSASFKIKLFDQNGTRVVPIAKSTITIGRGEHCDLVLDHPSMEPEHVRAWLEGGRIWIQDLGSSSGTFLNGIRLPHLKPMLVRDLDALKLGEYPASLGLEASIVRAPLVKQSVGPQTQPQPEARSAARDKVDPDQEKRRDELMRTSRELAELKLQLQMARLEKSSSEELRKQLQTLREEVKRLHEEREGLEAERNRVLATARTEASELKRQVELEIQQLRESQSRKFEHWKVDALAHFSSETHDALHAFDWSKLGVGTDVLLELETSIQNAFRHVVSREPGAKRSDSTSSPKTAKAAKKSKILRPKRKTLSWRFAVPVVTLVALGGGLWYWNSGSRDSRGLASQGAPSSATAPRPQPVEAKPVDGSAKVRFSYTDLVLYTERFADNELNVDVARRWHADLMRVGRAEWKLDEATVRTVASKEQQLIRDLVKLKSSLPQMKAREAVFLRELSGLLRQADLVDRYFTLKRGFYARLTASKS